MRRRKAMATATATEVLVGYGKSLVSIRNDGQGQVELSFLSGGLGVQ